MRLNLSKLILAGLVTAAVPTVLAAVAGAALGYIVGRTVVRVNGRPLEEAVRGASIQISPILGRDVRGVRVSVWY